MAYIKVKKNSNLATDPKMLARILKNNPKLRNRVGTVLRPGDVIKVDQKDIGIAGRGRGTTQRGKTPPPIPSKGNTPHKKAPTKKKPLAPKTTVNKTRKPASPNRKIVVKPLTQPVSVARPQPQQQVARRVTTQSPGMMGPSGVGSVQTRPTIRTMGPSGIGQAQTLPRAAARFDVAAQAGNTFNQAQAYERAKQQYVKNVTSPQRQTNPLGGGGYTYGRPLPKSPLERRAEQAAGYAAQVPTPLTPLGAERLGYTATPTPRTPPNDYERAVANIGYRPGEIVSYRLSQGIRPLIISLEALAYMDSIGMQFTDQDLLDMGYFFDGNNWIRLDKVDETGNVTSSSGQQLYDSYGYGGGYGGGGGWGSGGGGGYGGYTEQEQKRFGSEMGLVTWRI